MQACDLERQAPEVRKKQMTNESHHESENETSPPAVLLFCTDLMFTVQLQNIARKAELRPVVVKPGTPLPAGDLLVVDLASRADWEQPIREARQMGTTVVAFGPHMDAEGRRRAKEAGASRVLANSNLQRDLPAIFHSFRHRQASPPAENEEHDA